MTLAMFVDAGLLSALVWHLARPMMTSRTPGASFAVDVCQTTHAQTASVDERQRPQLQHTLYVQHGDIPCATGPLQSTCYSRGDLGGGHGLADYLFGLYWAQVAAQQSDDNQIATAGKLLAGFIESAVCSGMY